MIYNSGPVNKKTLPRMIKPIRQVYAIMYSRLLQIAKDRLPGRS